MPLPRFLDRRPPAATMTGTGDVGGAAHDGEVARGDDQEHGREQRSSHGYSIDDRAWEMGARAGRFRRGLPPPWGIVVARASFHVTRWPSAGWRTDRACQKSSRALVQRSGRLVRPWTATRPPATGHQRRADRERLPPLLVRALFHPAPIDARALGERVRRRRDHRIEQSRSQFVKLARSAGSAPRPAAADRRARVRRRRRPARSRRTRGAPAASGAGGASRCRVESEPGVSSVLSSTIWAASTATRSCSPAPRKIGRRAGDARGGPSSSVLLPSSLRVRSTGAEADPRRAVGPHPISRARAGVLLRQARVQPSTSL